jgi:hypothetical protein
VWRVAGVAVSRFQAIHSACSAAVRMGGIGTLSSRQRHAPAAVLGPSPCAHRDKVCFVQTAPQSDRCPAAFSCLTTRVNGTRSCTSSGYISRMHAA